MKVGYVQMKPEFGKVESNITRALELAGGSHADLLVLSELFTTGYLFKDRKQLSEYAETIPHGNTCRRMAEFAASEHSAIVYGFVERDSDKIFNTSVCITPAGDVYKYRKLHLFGAEKSYFDPGDLELEVIDLQGCRIGIIICFDYYFPEPCRVLALQGAQIVCHPSNLVTRFGQQVMRVRSIENRIYSVTANRIGEEFRVDKSLHFTGGSQITNITGDILCSASEDEETCHVIDIDPNLADLKHVTEDNDVIADRRPAFYRRIISG